jgi:hypothetical protein
MDRILCVWLTGESAMPIVRRSRADLDVAKVNWRRVAATTDREIAKQIGADPDTAPVFSVRELRRAKRVVPQLSLGFGPKHFRQKIERGG